MKHGKHIIGTIAYLGGSPALLEQFCWSWSQMIQYNADYLCQPNETIHYERARVSYHSYARNSLAEGIRGEWLLMLDTDHKFEPDLAARMLRILTRHNIDVLTALYLYKGKPHSPVVYNKNFEAIGDWDVAVEVFEIGSSGAGALLVKKSVFDKIWAETKEGPFDIIPPFSEDHSFFKRLEKLNIKSYCCPRIESQHLIIKPLSLASDYDRSEVKLSDRQEVGGYK